MSGNSWKERQDCPDAVYNPEGPCSVHEVRADYAKTMCSILADESIFGACHR